ncbi:hypothetical protein SLEP1_g18644 [Rubroshorea leprosula]|uniref:Uncharacterized protein n=1 Tax=Rubroshorea leprosula TaxID=152421 RepID=A0AAV5J724_9ROSI|nr:hypothetical protein SLEP1_g18644 [Rubroshorea leprosula]
MGHRCCSKQKVKRGLWSPEEDEKLIKHITEHGHGSWSSVPKLAGLQRCGKSCRLRWINYLRPDLKRGSFTAEEEQIIIDVHRILGNRWAQIAKHLPGRTDNEVKNFWNSCIKKKLLSQGLDPKTHNLLSSHKRPNRVHVTSSSQMQEQTFSVFNGSSQLMEIINPPLLTLPAAAPSSPLPIPIPNSHYQNPNVLWPAGNDPNSNESTFFPYGSSMENTLISSLSSTLSGVNMLDEGHCILGANGAIEPYRVPSMEEQLQLQLQQQEKEKTIVCDNQMVMDKIDGEIQEMDSSFDTSNFDLGFLMSGAMCRDNLNSMDDYNFAWNF